MNDMGEKISNLARGYLSRRYAVLFYSLLFTLACSPIFAALHRSGNFIESLLAASLLAAILPLKAVRGRPLLIAAMVVLWVARPLMDRLHLPTLSALTMGIWTIIALLAAAAALRFAMSASQISAEHLYASLSAYLLAGIYFGVLYWVLEHLVPGTFNVSGDFSHASAIYFSFVTLATLGYGDIVPKGDIARGLAIVEGVGGQLFLAVLVARLVSLYSKSGNQSS